MAPEQLNDEDATPAIDVYALAAVAYETLSGQRARRQPNPVALAYAIETKPPPDLREAWPQAPRAAADLLIRGMDHDPARRPRSAGELVDELSTALRSPARARVTHRPSARPAPTARRGPATVAAAAPAPSKVAPAPPTAPRPVGARSRSRLIPAAVLGLAGAAVIGAVALATSAGGPTRSGTSARTPTKPRTQKRASSAGATAVANGSSSSRTSAANGAGASAPTTTTTAAAAPAGAPGAAATSFYTLAAGHHFAQAWALADPAFRSQLGGYQSFENTFAADRRITVDSVRTLNRSASGATVALTTTSVRSDGTEHCTATVQLVPGAAGGGWLMHQIQVSCR